MKFETRFLPKIIEPSEVKFGDLLIANDDETARLVLVVEGQNGDQRGAVLAEWGQRTSNVLPNSGLLIHLREADRPWRLIDGDLAIEPLDYSDGSSLLGQRHTNGALTVFANGEVGLRVAPDIGGGAWVWSLFTGRILETSSTKYWVQRWRLVWRHGDDTLTLCQFPIAGA